MVWKDVQFLPPCRASVVENQKEIYFSGNLLQRKTCNFLITTDLGSKQTGRSVNWGAVIYAQNGREC